MRRALAVSLVLVAFALPAGLRPSSVDYDGLAFVLAARAGTVDHGHALYAPALRAVSATGLSPLLGAQLFSAAGLAVACVWLARHLARAGASARHAFLVTALFAASTLIWQQAGSIEPTTWTLAALLAAAEACARYAERRTLAGLALASLALCVALGFHVMSVCAVPWLARLARGSRPVPRAHLLVPLAGLGLALGVQVLRGGFLQHLSYWSGFLPSGEPFAVLAQHFRRGARFFGEGAPVLALGAVLALAWLRKPAAALVLALPYAAAFVALGKPLVGLLAPVILAAALSLGPAAAEATRRFGSARVTLALGFAAASQLVLTFPQALEWRAALDVPRQRAELLARYAPESTLLFSGALTNHFRYYHPGVELVSVPELVHEARAADRSADPIEIVRRAVQRAARRCVLTSDGAAYLQQCGSDPARLGISVARAFLVPEDPKLALFPLDGP